MRRIIAAMAAPLSIALSLAGQTQAAMAPKFERARALSEALKHLNEIAHLLKDPIDRIEYTNKGVVLFSAGTCSVPVSLEAKMLTQKEIENGSAADYISEVGTPRCAP